MFSIHQQTIRLYEKEGLITPKRSAGNTRLFTEHDLDRLEEIIHLTHELGINLAGVQMVLKLKKQLKKMQDEMNNMFDTAQKDLDKEADVSKEVVQTSANRLLSMKREQQKIAPPAPQSQPMPEHEETEVIDVDNWEVEYDE